MVYTEHSEDEEGSDNEPILFCKEAHVCGTAIESHCYAPGDTPRKGGRITTKNICCHCYIDGDLDLDDRKDVMKTHTLAGEGVLQICRYCLKSKGWGNASDYKRKICLLGGCKGETG